MAPTQPRPPRVHHNLSEQARQPIDVYDGLARHSGVADRVQCCCRRCWTPGAAAAAAAATAAAAHSGNGARSYLCCACQTRGLSVKEKNEGVGSDFQIVLGGGGLTRPGEWQVACHDHCQQELATRTARTLPGSLQRAPSTIPMVVKSWYEADRTTVQLDAAPVVVPEGF